MEDKSILTEIATLGKAKITSPILNTAKGQRSTSLVSDKKRILVDVDAAELTQMVQQGQKPLCFWGEAIYIINLEAF